MVLLPQVLRSTELNGLGAFVHRAADAAWAPRQWRGWPHLSIAMDQGSDGVCAVWWLQSQGVNLSVWCDPSHGAWADTKQSLKDTNLLGFWMLVMVGYNVPHGPWNDDARYALLKEAFADFQRNHTAKTSELFQHHAAEILHDIGGRSQLPGEKAVDEELWDMMCRESPVARKGYKVNLNRFFHGLQVARDDMRHWTARLMLYQFTAIENGMLASRRPPKVKAVASSSAAGSEEKPTTDATRLDVLERGIRRAGANALEIAVTLFEDRANKTLVRIILASTEPTEKWHRLQAHQLRSVEGSVAWLRSQFSGDWIEHVHLTLRRLSMTTVLEFCGFHLPSAVQPEDWTPLPGEILLQDDFAEVFGSMSVEMVKHRMKRCLWLLRGWPNRMAAVLVGGPTRARTVAAFRADHEAWQALAAAEGPTSDMVALLHRSVFRRTSVRQLTEAALSPNGPSLVMNRPSLRGVSVLWSSISCKHGLALFLRAGVCMCVYVPFPMRFRQAICGEHRDASGGLDSLMLARCSGLISSQICEDIFNHQKNSKILRGGRRFRRVERSMGVALSCKVVSQIHHYDAVPSDTAVPARSVRLPQEAFAAGSSDMSMKFGSISGTRAKTEWYSPGAPNFSQADADLHMILTAHRAGSWAMLSTAWIGALCESSHRLVLRMPGSQTWFMPLHHWPDSAVLALPVKVATVPGHPGHMWVEFNLDWAEPCLLAFTTFSGVLGHTFTWRSPMWHEKALPRAPQAFRVAVRPFLDELEPKPILELAARHCFWSIDKTTLDRLAANLEVRIEGGSTLFHTCLALVKAIGKYSDEEAMNIVAKRLARMKGRFSWSEGLLELDDATACLDHHDVKKVHDEMQAITTQKEEAEQFSREFRAKRETTRGSGGGGKPRRGGSSSSAAGKYPKKVPPINKISHQEAKKYIPEGASIWRGLQSGTWEGHFPPFRRVSRSWQRYGEDEALRLVLQSLWTNWHEFNGIPTAACPIEGIFSGGGGDEDD